MLIVKTAAEWVSMPRADGRVWTAAMHRHDLFVWDAGALEGSWEIIQHAGYRPRSVVVASGDGERDADAAKLRAEAVYAALTHELVRFKGEP